MKSKSKQTKLNKKQKKYIQNAKQYRIMKIRVINMKQQLKNKKHKSNQSQRIETECKMT